jgi:hypothetical protein
VDAADGGPSGQDEGGVAVAAQLRGDMVEAEQACEPLGVLLADLQRVQQLMLAVHQRGAALGE